MNSTLIETGDTLCSAIDNLITEAIEKGVITKAEYKRSVDRIAAEMDDDSSCFSSSFDQY